jgi:hypothetical protein
MAPRRFINYPSGQLLAVFDDLTAAESARAGLEQMGVAPGDLLVLYGTEGASRLDGLGGANGPLSRMLRAVQFMTMDQMPDFLLYETAIRGGRAVLAVRPRGDAGRRAAIETLARHGAHFVNFYGRFSTEEITMWRGPEPPIPGVFRR